MDPDQQKTKINDMVLRISVPDSAGPHPVILLLHGWTGDENAMWVFASRLPKNALLLAPRGLYKTPLGGYGWHSHSSDRWPWVDDFLPAIESLIGLLKPENFPLGDLSRLSMVGFSQGAALSYAFFLQHPYMVDSVAGLSGFIPNGSEALARNKPLNGKSIFVAHGSKDELIPIAKARKAVDILNIAGAQVTYCEDDVGHKLSSNCFNGLESFFKKSAN